MSWFREFYIIINSYLALISIFLFKVSLLEYWIKTNAFLPIVDLRETYTQAKIVLCVAVVEVTVHYRTILRFLFQFRVLLSDLDAIRPSP